MSGSATLWLDPTFGASGDMLLGALLGVSPDPEGSVEAVRSGLAGLAVSGWSLDLTTELRGSLSAWRAAVDAPPGHHHRSWSSIDALLQRSELPDAVIAGSRATFRRLGEVEAAMHQVTLDEVHFHEVGAVDAIVDIVGCWLAADLLDVTEIVAGPVGLGSGTVETAHGTLPLPAPATAQLLVGAPVHPLVAGGKEVRGETVTPTGAALLATMAGRWGPLPAGELTATARGAGGRNPDGYPNVLTAVLLAPALATASPDPALTPTSQRVVELRTNLDDATPEVVARVVAQLLELGADDAWSAPITMKKGRSGVTLSAMCRPELVATLEQLIFAETGSLGLRVRPAEKRVLPRSWVKVEVDGHPIQIKVGPYGAKPEFDDVAAAAEALGQPFRDVAAAALSALGSKP